MRPTFAAICVVLAFTEGCGYVGPVSPPSPEIPVPVTNLTAVERANQIEVSFTTPTLTTDLLPVKKFSAIELRAGPAVTPFDAAKWEASSKQYEFPSLPALDADDPQPVPLKRNIPVSDWQGHSITVAVRTAVKSGDHFSQWSPVNLEVIEPLHPPKVSAEATRDGYKLTWTEERPEVQYEILRSGPGQAAAASSIGTADKPFFVDSTSQWDVPYTYFVVAKKDAAESPRSQGVAVNHPDTFAPSIPQGVTALAGPDSVELTWSRSPEADLKGYRIYRAVANGPLEPLGDLINLPTFSDRKVEHGKTYRYAISAIDLKNNESEKSATVEVSF